MRNFLRFGFVLLFIFLGFGGVGQRKLPYPIILVHGLSGNYQSWNDFALYLNNNVGLNVPINSYTNSLDFNLNCDGNINTSSYGIDYCDITNTSYLTNCDAYIVDFNHGTKGNQSAIFKQGLAIRDAIKHVRNVTGSDKVILMGHSMGGLAARDYLQNSSKWQSDGQHHVAKLVTVGTPHGGSNGSGFGIFTDELSEAVRDLRYSYTTNYVGAYLFGGIESSSRITGRLSNFNNIDVNCNGTIGNSITGINQNATYYLPNEVDYSCIIGKGKPTYTGLYLISSSVDGDQIVESSRANINNYASVNASTFDVYTNATYTLTDSFHTNLKDDFPLQNIWALDETDQGNKAYVLETSKQYTGFFTTQSNNSTFDIDAYKINLPKGITTITIASPTGSFPSIYFSDPYGSTISNSYGYASTTLTTVTTANNYSGYHQINFSGYSSGSWNSYNYNIYNIPSSNLYANATSTCNQNVLLTASQSGYDSYIWYRDGIYFGTTATNYTNASTTASGTSIFTVKTTKWGVMIDGNNSYSVTNYVFPIPILTATSNGISSTTNLNICNGTSALLSNNCIVGTYPLWQNLVMTPTLNVTPSTTTNYTVQCRNYFCSSANSPPVRIINEPNIQSIKTGNWQDPTMWINNYIPLSCQTVTIQAGHTVNVPINDAKAKNIIIKGNLNFQNVSSTVKGKVSLDI